MSAVMAGLRTKGFAGPCSHLSRQEPLVTRGTPVPLPGTPSENGLRGGHQHRGPRPPVRPNRHWGHLWPVSHGLEKRPQTVDPAAQDPGGGPWVCTCLVLTSAPGGQTTYHILVQEATFPGPFQPSEASTPSGRSASSRLQRRKPRLRSSRGWPGGVSHFTSRPDFPSHPFLPAW